ADRLREDHVGMLRAFEAADLVEQVIELAAEASAGDFLDGEALLAQRGSIDEVLGLIVGDNADALALVHVMTGEAGHRRGFARAEKAAQHDKADRGHVVILATESWKTESLYRSGRGKKG